MLAVALLGNSLVDQGGRHLHLQVRYVARCKQLYDLTVGCNGRRPHSEPFLGKASVDQGAGDCHPVFCCRAPFTAIHDVIVGRYRRSILPDPLFLRCFVEQYANRLVEPLCIARPGAVPRVVDDRCSG